MSDPLAKARGTRPYRGELDLALTLLEDLKDTIKAGLNAGNGDGEWEALVNAGDLLGLEYDEEEDKYA